MTEIESLSDIEEIWYLGVFEGADFKNRIHFSVNSCSGGHSRFLRVLVLSPKNSRN